MKSKLYLANERGHMNYGWLDAYHTFSFGKYFDPDKVSFGTLRVLNDDIVLGGTGFGTHPHENMEIISIPLYGSIEHKDNMGHTEILKAGEVQVMSAGTGIYHSEYNADPKKPLNLFQIWIYPDQENVQPRYAQKKFDFVGQIDKLIEIVSPNREEDNLWIHQDAWLNIGTFSKETEIDYLAKKSTNGVFLMVIDGEFSVEGNLLGKRDAIGIWEHSLIKIKSLTEEARILVIDIPMV